MQKIIPYKTVRDAHSALDNGGRFYNFLTAADDGQIEASELAKVAGVFTDQQKMILYLDMAIGRLPPDEASSVISAMTEELQAQYQVHRPNHFTPAQANQSGRSVTSATVTGIPRHVQSSSDFTGFIMVPVTTGKMTTFVMVPMIDQYDVYEVCDVDTKDEFLIAHVRGVQKLPQAVVTVGGILKELQGDKESKPKHSLFLESLYFVDVGVDDCTT